MTNARLPFETIERMARERSWSSLADNGCGTSRVDPAIHRRPVTDDEAALLIRCFGPDDCFGLAWTLLHLIETAPGRLPLKAEPSPAENEWVRRLWDRAHGSTWRVATLPRSGMPACVRSTATQSMILCDTAPVPSISHVHTPMRIDPEHQPTTPRVPSAGPCGSSLGRSR